jgi:SET domain-containing protein
MSIYCNINTCPFDGKCGNGLDESAKLFLGRNTRTSVFGVVAGEDISAGEVLGQYLGEMEHVRIATADRPRNNGYRLVMKTRPERPSRPVLVAINAERMGGLMRFVNHSCKPVATFMEVAAGRRTTVVVVTTEKVRRGQEVTVDYGDDLWFICRCQREGCVHRHLQHLQDP